MSAGPAPIVVASGPDEPVAPYVAALLAAGAAAHEIVIVDSAGDRAEESAARVARAAGLLLCGGVDVAPERYGEAVRAPNVSVDPRRDQLDLGLLAAAQAHGVPVFAICRGVQVLNVFLGGSLHQDLPTDVASEVNHSVAPQEALAHAAFVEAVSHPLADALRREPLVVNSSHHQGIRTLAPRLLAVARAADDVLEAAATAADDPWWVRGVQWHPENLLEMPVQRELFTSFLAVSRARAGMGATFAGDAAKRPAADGALA